MSYKPKDRFERFIKNRVDVGLDNQEDWNTPPDVVFANAINEINNKKKEKRKRYLFFLLPALSVVALLAYLITERSRVNDLSNGIQKVRTEIAITEGVQRNVEERTNENIETLKESEAEEKNVVIAEIEVLNKESSFLEEGSFRNSIIKNELVVKREIVDDGSIVNALSASESNAYSRNETSKVGSSDIKTTEVISSAIVLPSNGSTKSNSLLNEDNDLGQKGMTVSDSIILLDALESIAQTKIFVENNAIRNLGNMALAYVFVQSRDNVSKSSPFSLSIILNQNLSSLKMKPILSGGTTSLNGYEKRYYGYGLGSALNYKISDNFYSSISVNYSNYSNASVFKHQQTYIKTNEKIDINGLVTYCEDMVIETPFGTYQSEMEFGVDPAGVVENKMINQTSVIDQNFTTIGVGFGLGYNQQFSKNISWYIDGGLRYNHFLNLSNKMETELMLDDKMMSNFKSESKGMDTLEEGFSAYSLGTGFKYNLNSGVDLSLGASYLRSISSLRSQTGILDPSLHLSQVQFSFGAQMKF